MQEALNDVELFGDGRTRLETPLFRHNRQIVEVPAGVAAVVDIRLRLFKQVTDTPGDHLPVTAFDKAVSFAMRPGSTSAMARARLGFSAINNRIELTDLNHRATTAGGHQLTNGRQGDAKLGSRRLNVSFSFRRHRQQQAAGGLRIAQQVTPRFRHFAH